MNKLRIVLPIISLTGACLIGYGLYQPLVDVPAVGAIRFTEDSLGGAPLACGIIAVLITGALLLIGPRPLVLCGALISLLGVGFLSGVLISIYRFAMGQVEIMAMGGGQIAADIEKLLAQMKYDTGCWLCAIGTILVILAAALSLFSRRLVANHESSR